MKFFGKQRRSAFSRGIALAAALLLLAGCSGQGSGAAGSSKAAEPKEKLNTATKLVVGQNSNYFPLIVAEEKGWFKEEFGDAVKVELPHFANGPAQNEAISAGQLDIANMGDMPTIQAWSNGTDIKVISYLWEAPKGYSLIATKASGIAKLEDLKGKKVGVGLGTNNHKLLLKFLAAVHLTDKEVQIVNMKTADTVSALTAGSIDATLVDEPNRSNLLKLGTTVEVADAEGYDKVMTITYGRREYLEKNPEIVARYFKVVQKAIDWIKESDANLDEAVKIVARVQSSNNLEATRLYYQSKVFRLGVDKALIDALDDTLRFNIEQKIVPDKGLKAADLVDDRYVKAAGLPGLDD